MPTARSGLTRASGGPAWFRRFGGVHSGRAYTTTPDGKSRAAPGRAATGSATQAGLPCVSLPSTTSTGIFRRSRRCWTSSNARQVDEIVIGGDIVPGPMPGEVLDALAGLTGPVRYIQGNCEVAVLAHLAGKDLPPLPEPVRESMRWSAAQLAESQAREMAAWPKTLRISIEKHRRGAVLSRHAAQRERDFHAHHRGSRAAPDLRRSRRRHRRLRSHAHAVRSDGGRNAGRQCRQRRHAVRRLRAPTG